MSRVMAIDYGKKRCGVATTDPLQIAAHPLAAVSRGELLVFVSNYVLKEEVERIVLGIPTHADGSKMILASEIEDFGRQLKMKHNEIEISFQDESFTSRDASKILAITAKKKTRKDKSKLDVLSAVLILQRYLQHI